MITNTRYITASGSIYEVRLIRTGHDEYRVRRLRLGKAHQDIGDHQVAKRNADALGITSGDWVKARQVAYFGVGKSLVISFNDPTKDLVTAPVEKVEMIE